MLELKASKDLLLELREVHSGLHSAMDALMKHFDPAEAGRILILVDNRLTSLVNRAAAEQAAPVAPGPRPLPIRPAEAGAWTADMLFRFCERSKVPGLLAEASQQAGKRIEIRRVESGLDLVAEGLAEPLGTVRLGQKGTAKVVYAPRVGSRTYKIEPDAEEFERWAISIVEVWRTALANVGQRRRQGRSSDDETDKSSEA